MSYDKASEVFSISHAEILDGATSFTDAIQATATDAYDVYGVDQGNITPQIDDYDNEGDDVILSTWAWLRSADLAIRGGYISFALMETLTGQATVSSTLGGRTLFEQDLWHEDALNVAPKPALITLPSKDKLGVPGSVTIGLYRAQFRPITFEGPAYKQGLKVNWNARVLYSTVDEVGSTFSDGKRRVGKILAWESAA